jgi:hypothetical protein
VHLFGDLLARRHNGAQFSGLNQQAEGGTRDIQHVGIPVVHAPDFLAADIYPGYLETSLGELTANGRRTYPNAGSVGPDRVALGPQGDWQSAPDAIRPHIA